MYKNMSLYTIGKLIRISLVPVASGSARPLGATARDGAGPANSVRLYRSQYCLSLGLAGDSDTTARDWSD
jgi:hypothetical protein